MRDPDERGAGNPPPRLPRQQGRLAAKLLAAWQTGGFLSDCLLPLSWLFRLLAAGRRFCYRTGLLKSVRLPVPVIVIGNLTVGGTGKTPLVIRLAQHLTERGYRPGIISRGYGGQLKTPVEVLPDSLPAEVGDEPALIRQSARCPVVVFPDRIAAGQALLAAHPEVNVILSDDGLQHYALARDLEVVVVDGRRGFGNGRHLPAGPLRESPARLKAVDAVVINGGDFAVDHPWATRMHLIGHVFESLADPSRHLEADAFQGQNVHAIAGIGDPQRFFDSLRALGIEFTPHPFADHHAYCRKDLEQLHAQVVLMTAKDGVKCRQLGVQNCWVLPVTAALDPALLARIEHRLEMRHGSKTA